MTAHENQLDRIVYALIRPPGTFSQWEKESFAYLSPAALRSSSALSVFSHENAVAVCCLPAASA